MKKILTSSIIAAMAVTSSFAMQPHSNLHVALYGGGFTYTNSKDMDYKRVIGATVSKKIGVNKLMLDLKYVYFKSSIVKPHKWDFTGEYTINNLNPQYQMQVGGKLTFFSKDGHKTGYTVFAGVNEKHPVILSNFKVKTGIKAYYTDLSDLISNQKIYQVDLINKKKVKGILGGALILENTLTYQHLKEKNFENRNNYVSDVLAAKLVKGKTIYMGHVSFGHSALKIEKDAKYAMDTSASVHKWGVGAGIAYKVKRGSKVFAKFRYNSLKTPFGDDHANEIKYVVGYALSF